MKKMRSIFWVSPSFISWNIFMVPATSFWHFLFSTSVSWTASISLWVFFLHGFSSRAIIRSCISIYHNLAEFTTFVLCQCWIIEFLLDNIVILFCCTLVENDICVVNIFSFTLCNVIEHLGIVVLHLVKMDFVVKKVYQFKLIVVWEETQLLFNSF